MNVYLILSIVAQLIFVASWKINRNGTKLNSLPDGTLIDIKDAPYRAWVYNPTGQVIYDSAAGVIISNRIVLTTASICLSRFDGMPALNVFAGCTTLGDNNTQNYGVKKIVTHPKYNVANGPTNNLAMLYLDRYIPWDSQTVKPVALNTKKTTGHTTCIYTAWRRKQVNKTYISDHLESFEVVLWNFKDCEKKIQNIKGYPAEEMYQRCFHGEGDTCTIIPEPEPLHEYEVGAPLVCQNKLFAMATSDNYLDKGVQLYHDVGYYNDWIRRTNASLHDSASTTSIHSTPSIPSISVEDVESSTDLTSISSNNSAFDMQRSNFQETCLITMAAFLLWST
ncbi:uncharacterized protein LOC124460395 [Drosophila willistoni]|uniref:uncharacterized protein LOC124460395 n=1 Tax=Drosophila willistoni TaxID=7260 RepID=UPI001F08605E|nr:uncharacterized protein LOC124460395 [Drosophila willistoni]